MAVGVSVTVKVLESYTKEPGEPVAVVPLSIVASIASLKVAVIFVSSGTLVAPSGGNTEVTVGGVRSGAFAVEKLNKYSDASATPAVLLIPVVSTTEYAVLAAIGLEGWNTAVLLVVS